MPGPWEKYAAANSPAPEGPWAKYATNQKVPQEQLDQIQRLNAQPTQFEQNGGQTGSERFADPTAENGLLSRAANYVRGGVSTITAPLLHPVETLKGMGEGIVAGGSTPYGTPITAPTGNQQIDQQNEQTHRDAQQRAMDSGADAIKNHPAYLAGQLTAPLVLGEAIKSPAVRGVVSDRLAPVVAGAEKVANKVTAPLRGEPIFPNKMDQVIPEAKSLSPIAKEGVEHVFKAAAPTGMNKGFKTNVVVAAGDLAEIGKKIDLESAKGGLVNPDYRASKLVNGIREHLNEMYETERAPQIDAHADIAVKVGASEDAARGLEYLQKAGTEPIRALAEKAFNGEHLSLSEADTLAKAANENLHTFERMTPEGKVQASIANPKIGGLKSLDMELGNTINDTLQAQGESGIRSYERRFAALSQIRDAIEARKNAIELNTPGVVKGVIRPIATTLTSARGGIASASQAAVADVNIGRTLQVGINKLIKGGVVPLRDAAPRGGLPLRLTTGTSKGPIVTPPPADPSGLRPNASVPYSNTTRAQRLGLLLPEKTAIEAGPGADPSGAKVLKPNTRIVRDPKTGKMKRQYLNSGS